MPNHIFGRSTKGTLPTAVGGDGCYLIDSTGKRYLDGSGGAAVSCLGHPDPDVRAALHAQVDQLAVAHTGFFTSAPAESLADTLIAHAPPASTGSIWFRAAQRRLRRRSNWPGNISWKSVSRGVTG